MNKKKSAQFFFFELQILLKALISTRSANYAKKGTNRGTTQ
jgi:hypothetical protein